MQARDASHFDGWADAQRNARVTGAHGGARSASSGLSGIEHAEAGSLSYGGQRLLDMGLALAGAPRVLLLDEPLAGLAAAERERVGGLIKRISADLPVLLVEHDIDRVFALADRVTVMNEGKVLVDGTADEARDSPAVREVYIGSGTAALAAQAARPRRARGRRRCCSTLDRVDAFYGKSHIVKEASLARARARDRRAARPQRRRQVDAAEDDHRHRHAPRRPHLARPARISRGRPAAAIARRGVGYVPQGRGLFAGMSVRHNLELGRLKRARRRGRGVVGRQDPRVLSALARAARHAGRFPVRAASSRWWRSRARCPGTCACCCWTSRSKDWRPR